MTSRTVLPNGLTILVRENHSAPVAAFMIFYRVGSRNEVPGLTGVSHWVEHMLFKGTPRFPRGALDKAISRAGGIFNGMTSQDWTIYYETLPAERIGLAIEAEADRLANSLFDAAEFESERTVIIAEREGSENSFAYLLNEEVQAAAFQSHPYRHPVIGWKNDLYGMALDDLVRHYRAWYTPNNAVAVAVGDFDSAEMTEAIAGAFGPLPPGVTPSLPHLIEPEQHAERRVYVRGSDPTPYLEMAFHAPGARHPDFFALIALDAVLSGAKGLGIAGGGGTNRTSRLHMALVETKLAVDAATSYRPSLDPELFAFYVTPAPDVAMEAIEQVIWATLRGVQERGVTEAEVAKAIKQTRAQFAYSSDSVTTQAYWLGFAETVTSQEWMETWPDLLAAISPADVQRVACTYFSPDKQTTGWYLPKEDMDDESGLDDSLDEDGDIADDRAGVMS